MNKIYLVGLPGAGKSHCGRWLAEQLDWNFMDLDGSIEHSMQKSISKIFDEHGEDVFRQIESDELMKTKKLRNTVISTGGGTASWGDNMEWMQRNGLTVFINTPIDKIVSRIMLNAQKRPMFAGLQEGEIKEKLSEIEKKRGEFYSRAKLIWNRELPNDKFYVSVSQLLALYSARF
ncbi:MAG: shikimate kinase [Bacteroidetes bacterium]|nr:shikimate kinase [Bacteroidota bacterium]